MVEKILEVWKAIMTWFITNIPSVEALFWKAPTGSEGTGSLTFLGLLAVVSLGVAVFFLILGLLQKFLHLRS